MSSAHVPKFGNWEDKDIPYTKYFENARKERTSGFNPNDPEDNPEAFMPRNPVQKQDSRKEEPRPSFERAKTKSYNDKSRLNSSFPPQPHHVSRPPTSPMHASPASSVDSTDHIGSVHQKPATLPKFGSWDEKDPKRGDNTVINNEVKEKKQNGTTKLSAVAAKITVPLNKNAKQRTSSQKLCCFFPLSRE